MIPVVATRTVVTLVVFDFYDASKNLCSYSFDESHSIWALDFLILILRLWSQGGVMIKSETIKRMDFVLFGLKRVNT